MMLADPGFMETEAVEPLHQLQVAVHARRRVLVHWMEGRQEDAVAKVDLTHHRPLGLAWTFWARRWAICKDWLRSVRPGAT